MAAIKLIYPPSPQQVSEGILQPSAEFRREVFKTFAAILFFITVYFVLVLVTVAIAAISAWAGFALVVSVPRFITLMIGIGLVGLGLMLVFFLFKFLFTSKKVDRSSLIEVNEQEQPVLFEFIRTLSKETRTPFPKRIYLSSDVNAAVFYDSNFWSMLLPVRKNLQIGLALVNSVNLSELKAILAHEFGHFSQRSMKLGSYVYNVNQVIYNLLYDNDGYSSALQKWANVSGYFAFFAGITARLVMGIQWVLQKVYGLINKTYMSLSRQMEFHADTVSAYVSGADHIISSLRRLDVANVAYDQLLNYYNLWFKEGLKVDNLYPQHTTVMHQLAQEHDLPLVDGLPQVDANSFARYNKARVVVKDQWASHPSTDDREKHLRSLNITTPVVTESAWNLFSNVEELQQRVTAKLYSGLAFERPPQMLDIHHFRQRYQLEVDRYKLDGRYKGYYNTRTISETELSKLPVVDDVHDLESLLTADVINLPFVVDGLKSDLETLQAIESGSLPARTFEFEGKKYKRGEASLLITQLQRECEEAEQRLLKADQRIIGFFFKLSKEQGKAQEFAERYLNLFEQVKVTEADQKKYIDIMVDMQPIYATLEFDQIRQVMEKIKLHEVLIKERLKTMLADHAYAEFITEGETKRVQEYISRNHVYFVEPNYNNEALALLNEALGCFHYMTSERAFKMKKDVLNWQLSLLPG